MSNSIIKQIIDGRTDLVFDYLAEGHAATSTDKDGVSLIKWCAYFGDVSGIKFLLANGESIVNFRQQCMIFLEQSCMHCCRKLTIYDFSGREGAKGLRGFRFKGGGGTDFRPAIAEAAKWEPDRVPSGARLNITIN